MTIWLWLVAPFIGLLLGLFGAGGGMLTVPLLSYGAGLPFKEAIATSLWVVAVVSLIATTQQRGWQVLRPKLLAFFMVGGIIGGLTGAWTGSWIAVWIQQALFALLLLLVAWWMQRVKLSDHYEEKPCRCGLALLIGTGHGLLTGLLGVGGGFLMVPSLLLLGISHLPTAVVHSLVMIACNATVSGLVYLKNTEVSLSLIITVSVLAGIGSLIGSRLLLRLSKERLQQGFSIGLFILGLAMFGQLLITRFNLNG